jgi:hypothetical protein
LGRDFFLTGYRIFARFRTAEGRLLRGLRILRSDADRRTMVWGGNLLTHYGYRLATAALSETSGALEISVTTPGAEADVHVAEPARIKRPVEPVIEPDRRKPRATGKVADDHAAVVGRLSFVPRIRPARRDEDSQRKGQYLPVPHGLFFLLRFENESKEVPAHSKPFRIDFSLRFIKFLNARHQLVAPVDETFQLIGRHRIGILRPRADSVKFPFPVILGLGRHGSDRYPPATGGGEDRDRACDCQDQDENVTLFHNHLFTCACRSYPTGFEWHLWQSSSGNATVLWHAPQYFPS